LLQTKHTHNELVQEDVSRVTSLQASLTFATSLADVAGTQEPEYGPSAIQPVTKQAELQSYTELSPEHLKWLAMESTCVETQAFYFMTDEGMTGMAQVIYSNVM